MPRRRSLRGTLRSFLDTLTSRYSDYQGYWLLGQLPESDLSDLCIDLLTPAQSADTPGEALRWFATRKFAEQITKSGLSMEVVSAAELRILATDEQGDCRQGDHVSRGRRVRFQAIARTDLGRTYEICRSLIVAPHDPRRVRRRHVDQWGAGQPAAGERAHSSLPRRIGLRDRLRKVADWLRRGE